MTPATPAFVRPAAPTGAQPARYTETDCRLEDFAALLNQEADLGDYPYASGLQQGVLVYDAVALGAVAEDGSGRQAVQAELVRALTEGPGVVLVRRAFSDLQLVDRITAVFEAIIAEERASGRHSDHFGEPGANDRVWNALGKLGLREPEAFVDYYGNDVLALVSEAWLGPGYQMTSQVNVVRAGGRAQQPHRDYHLGFLSNSVAASYPAQVHRLSPVLTLQGAVAHSEMPVESGPTTYLPYSHQYAPGYLAWRLPEFEDYFAAHYVQPPLAKGDAAFFNPAVFHGAGRNRSADVQRMANLLQVSSAFGRAMETVDRTGLAVAVYPALRSRRAAGVDPQRLTNAVACVADGYPFPTNLDLDENVAGLTPRAQFDVLEQALAEDWDLNRAAEALQAYASRHRAAP